MSEKQARYEKLLEKWPMLDALTDAEMFALAIECVRMGTDEEFREDIREYMLAAGERND